MNFIDRLVPSVLLFLITAHHVTAQGDTLNSTTNALIQQLQSTPMDVVLTWNLVSLQTISNDFNPEIITGLDQPGAGRVSRALAIIHAAMYEAMVVFNRHYKSVFTTNDLPSTKGLPKVATMEVAITQAAYEALYSLYPKQRAMFDAIRTFSLQKIQKSNPSNRAIETGVEIGQKIANAILLIRANDGSRNNVTYTPNMLPGYHKVDPTRLTQGFDAPQWGGVTPFIIDSVLSYRVSDIVGNSASSRLTFINSEKYIEAFEEVKLIGARFSTNRTDDQTEIGKFWGYDGARKIGPSPRMYNQVVRVIAIQSKNKLVENAHLFAMVNFALADTRISAYDSKYYYAFWRPIIGIREGTSNTTADPAWLPLGAGANGNGDNFTPPHPSYPSGHVSSASGIFQILRSFYGTDSISFKFQSEEFNGRTNDSITQTVRPAKTRQYKSLSQAERENFMARIYLGIHWRFDEEEALTMGRRIAIAIFNKFC